MIEWILIRHERLLHSLVTRFPDLYLLKLHVVVPLVAVLQILSAVAAKSSPMALEVVPDAPTRLGVGLGGSVILALIWGYFVVRDWQQFWPARGMKRYLLLCTAAFCLTGFTAVPLFYEWQLLNSMEVFAEKVGELSKDYRTLEQDRETLNSDQLRAVETTPSDSLRRADALTAPRYVDSSFTRPVLDARESAYRKGVEEYGQRVLALAANRDKLPKNLVEKCDYLYPWLNWRRDHSFLADSKHFDVPCSLGLACSGLILVILVLVQETSFYFGLILTGCLVAYFGVWLIALNLSGAENSVFGMIILLHWVTMAFFSAMQWETHSGSWFARVNSVMLGLTTAFLPLAWKLAFGESSQVFDYTDLPWLVMECYALYVCLFWFIHGNLVRLRYLPLP